MSFLLFTVQQFSWAIWIGCSVAGLGMGSFFAASISWTTQNLQITGKAAAVINLDALGVMAMAFLIGQLFDSPGPMTFLYICMADTFLLTLIVILSSVLARFYRKHYRQRQPIKLSVLTPE